MTKTYYEAHITLGPTAAYGHIKNAVEKINWKFSKIDGDPVMGAGVKCYATRHFNAKWPAADVVSWLHEAADKLDKMNIEVMRRKVELVIYDDRSSKVRCSGGCVECHLDDLA